MSEVTSENAVAAEAPEQPKSIQDLKPKMKLKAVVNRLELYGAFVDIGIDTPAMIHISQMGSERVNRVADVLKENDEITVWVDKVDTDANQIMVSMVEPLAVEWRDLEVGQTHSGKVTRLETFGAFIDIGAEREGLVHISELSHDYVKQPSEVVNVGDEVQTQVLGFSKRKRRIDLSIKALQAKPEQEMAQAYEPNDVYEDDYPDEDMPTAMELALRQALGDEDMPKSRKKKEKRKDRRKKERMRSQQDDLLNRTLDR